MALVALLAAGVLYGTVTIGPTSPVCHVDSPCSRPAKNIVLLFTRATRSLSVRTDARGRYRIKLPTGTWRVRASVGRGIKPARVFVRADTHRLDVAIDTGIR